MTTVRAATPDCRGPDVRRPRSYEVEQAQARGNHFAQGRDRGCENLVGRDLRILFQCSLDTAPPRKTQLSIDVDDRNSGFDRRLKIAVVGARATMQGHEAAGGL